MDIVSNYELEGGVLILQVQRKERVGEGNVEEGVVCFDNVYLQ